jgi:IMP dehydrogenase
MRFLNPGLTFDDILLIPRKSTIPNRSTDYIDLMSPVIPGHFNIKYPLISANMDTVTSVEMASEMVRLGGLGIIHRFMSITDHIKALETYISSSKSYKTKSVACIGIGKDGIDRLEALRPYCSSVLIDIAHGHSDNMIDQVKRVKDRYPNLPIIAGNVATAEGALDLIEVGANAIKIGVGPGALCSTRVFTGCGVPQLTAILNVAAAIKETNQPVGLIADGGIRNSGDIMKALAAGADTVMIGKLFAGTTETPGDLFSCPKRGLYKTYRGMSSETAQRDWKGYVKSVEGEVTQVSWRGPVESIFTSIVQNLLSGMSYLNAKNLHELRENACAIPQSLASMKESTPHGIL